MKKLCESAFNISNADRKALDHYLLTTPKEWAQGALNGMINKATTTILKDYFDEYRSSQSGSISTDQEVLLPAIIAMPTFKPYNIPSDPKECRKAERTEGQNQEIFEGGFEVEDYQDAALRAFYKDPEQTLLDFMENKIALRKKAFMKEICADQTNNTIPAKIDEAINMQVAKPSYMNRKQRDAEELS